GGDSLTEPKLRLNIRSPAAKQGEGNALSKAADKKRKNIETMPEAWARILSMKNSAPDQRRLSEVKQCMDGGGIGRAGESAGKRLSRAGARRLWRELAAKNAEERLRKMVEDTPDNYRRITDKSDFETMLSELLSEELIVFDGESTGV